VRRKQWDEEYWLREQQGLSHPATPENLSSEEEEDEEESDGGRAPTERWNPPSPSLRAVEAAEEQAPAVGAEMPAAGRSVEEAARAAEASVSATVAAMGITATTLETLRKRKWGFSSLR
jgi:hypothetical protein